MTANYPALEPQHLDNAKLYANRQAMISDLCQYKPKVIAEVGVAHGEFSDFLLRTLSPEKFLAIDVFEMHLTPSHWGIPQEYLFKGMTHREFYAHRFNEYGNRVIIEQGLSHEALSRQPDNLFDLIYLDAGHSYDEVRKDTEVAIQKIKRDGILIFNDYIMSDHYANVPYGVVQVANELVVNCGWDVIGFALDRSMFCDLAVRRSRLSEI